MRKTHLKEWKTGLLLTAGALFLLSTSPSLAGFGSGGGDDNAQLSSRLNQLETQIQTLSRAVYKGESRPLPMAAQNGAPAGVVYSNDDMMTSPGAAAGYEDRLNQLEASQRRLTGQIEQLTYEVQQMKSRVNRVALDSPRPDNNSGSQSWQSSTSNAARSDNRSYNRQPPGEEEYGGIGGNSASNEPRGKILGTMSSSNAAESPGALYDDAFSDIRDARYDSAAEKFQRFLTKYPTNALAANAQYWLAETYYVRQDYKQGAKLFAQNYQEYPKGAKASASLLKLGLSLSRLGKKDDACLTFQQLKKEFPGDQTPEVQRAQREIQQLNCKI